MSGLTRPLPWLVASIALLMIALATFSPSSWVTVPAGVGAVVASAVSLWIMYRSPA
jgi:hypothetical protein